MADAEDIDLSAVLPQDPSGRAMAMANALRGKQTEAMNRAISLNNPQAVPGMLNEQAAQGFGMLEHAAERQLKGAELEKALMELREHLRHTGVEEGNAAQRLAMEQAKTEKEAHPDIPETEAAKFQNSNLAIDAVHQVRDAHSKYLQLRDEALKDPTKALDAGKALVNYRAILSAKDPIITAGATPAARENAELMRLLGAGFPGLAATQESADAFFEPFEAGLKSYVKAQGALLKAGHYNPKQVNALLGGAGTEHEGGAQEPAVTKAHAAPHMVEERKESGPKGRTLQKMSDGSIRVKP